MELHRHLVSQAASFALAISAMASPTLADEDPKSVSYSGTITPYLVENFISQIELKGATRLVVNSQGGDLAAAIRLGRWILANNLDVEVRGQCRSACANYLFPAGRKKIIGPRSVVMWHGSAEQKDIRELQARYSALLLKSHADRASLTEEEVSWLKDNRIHFEHAVELRELQARFFDEVRMNEQITRLGQEFIKIESDWWAASPRLMERFGIRNIEAPADYATHAYFERVRIPFEPRVPIFDQDSEGRVVLVPRSN